MISSTQIYIKGKPVKLIRHNNVSEENFLKAQQSQKFNNWVNSFDNSEIEVRSITMLLVYMFGKANVGFINLDVEAYQNDKKLPGFAFIRGGAVAVLLLVNGTMLVTRQFRVPTGKFQVEAPAGMVDESKHFSGVAAKELKEECGIEVSADEMKELGDYYVSSGGSDEQISLFVVEKQIPEDQYNQMLSKIHGSEEEGEQINIVPLEFNWENILKTGDSKLICAAAYYHQKFKKI